MTFKVDILHVTFFKQMLVLNFKFAIEHDDDKGLLGSL